jgi:putative membrane protein
MLLDALLAFLHYIAIFLTVAFLATGMALCRAPLNAEAAKRLSRVDLIYFIAAMLALATGLARVFLGAKGWAFYLYNPVFYAKVSVFMLIGLISIRPTIQFVRWKKLALADPFYRIPDADVARVRKIVHIEFALLVLLPLLATLMARGIGA